MSGENGSGETFNRSYESGCLEFAKERELATVTLTCVFLSLVASLAVVLLVCGLKKCYILSQRLILYLSLAAILKCLCWVHVVIQYDLPYGHSEFSGATTRFCSAVGYFLTVTGWCEASAVTCVATNLLLNMVFRKSHKRLEVAYILAIFVLPFTLTWIPFTVGAYGQTGYYCWIRTQTDKCERFGFGIALQLLLWYIPLLLCLLYLLLLYYRMAQLASRKNQRWDGNSNPARQRNKPKIHKHMCQLIWCPLSYFLLYLIPFAAHLYLVFFSRPVLSLWFMSAITQPLQGALAAVAFTLDGQTIRRLRRQNLTATVCGLGQSVVVEDYPTHITHEDQLYEQSQHCSSSSSEQEEGDDGPRRGRYTEYS